MKFLKLIVVFLLLFSKLYSQNISEKDSIYIDHLVQCSKDSFNQNPQLSFSYAQEVVKLSNDFNYTSGLLKGYSILGVLYQRLADYKNSILYSQKVIDLTQSRAQGSMRVRAAAFCNLSSVYQALGDHKMSFETAISALDISLELKDTVFIGACYNRVAISEDLNGNKLKAILYFEKAIKLERIIGDPQELSSSINNLSNVYTSLKEYDKALKYLYEAKKICVDIKDDFTLMTIESNIGECYYFKDVIDSALYYYNSSLSKARQMNYKLSQIICLNNLGKLYLNKRANFNMAELCLFESLKIAKESNEYNELKNILNNITDLYVSKKDYKKAFEYQKQFLIVSDSLMNLQKINAIEELSVRFETKEIETKNKNLQNEIALQINKIERKNYFIYSAVLLALLIGVIFILYIRQNKFKMQKESLDIEQKLLQIQMNPHFIFNSLQAIQSFILTNKQEQSSSYLTSFSRLMRLILENSKQDFITLDKEITTLKYYLELQKLRFKDIFDYSINVNETIDKEFLLVPPMLLQPFIENAIEHGFKNLKTKGYLEFNVVKSQNHLILEVIDNGLGIERSIQLKMNKNHHSYALEIINKRIELLNLKLKQPVTLIIEDLSFADKTKHGTKITIQIPFINLK
jgi:tetratricopeptide (TPR) repeat protein